MKPTIMILGSLHMANPDVNTISFDTDDVLAPKRQRELQQLVEQLARFRPTKIAIEVDTSLDAKINAQYQELPEWTLSTGKK